MCVLPSCICLHHEAESCKLWPARPAQAPREPRRKGKSSSHTSSRPPGQQHSEKQQMMRTLRLAVHVLTSMRLLVPPCVSCISPSARVTLRLSLLAAALLLALTAVVLAFAHSHACHTHAMASEKKDVGIDSRTQRQAATTARGAKSGRDS